MTKLKNLWFFNFINFSFSFSLEKKKLTGITNASVYQFGNNLCDTIKKDLIRIDYLNKNLNKRRKQLIKVASERIKNRIIDMH